MFEMEDIIKKAEKLVHKETSGAVRPLFSFANEIGQVLAEKLNADKKIVRLGTLLMDLKLKQAMSENRIQDHIEMSLQSSKEFLEQFHLDEETKNKIYNCIEAHHGEKKFICIEAEICANADCYKFLHPRGALMYVCILNERHKDLDKAIEGTLKKIEAKHSILSLDICRKELEPYHKKLKSILEKAK